MDFATGLDPVLPLNTSHGMRVGSIDCIQPSKPLPQSPRVTRKSTGESLTTALTGFASTCDADLPFTRDPTGPFAPESALSTHSPSQTFPHHTAEETLGEDSTLQKFAIIRGTLSSMTGTVHEWFKSAATSLPHLVFTCHICFGIQVAGFAETSPAQETTTQTRVFTKGMATNGSPLPLQSPSLESTSGYDYSICPSHAQETMTQTHRVFTMGMPTNGSPLPPQSESLNLTCGVSTMGTPINGNPLQSQPLTVESTSGYDYSICHLSSHRISSLAVNAHNAIGSQESIRTTADHNSEETRLHVLSSDHATRKVFTNNLDIEESLPSAPMTTNDHLSDTPSTYMSADLATRKVFAHQLHESTTLEWAKYTHDIEKDLPHPTTLEDFALACTFYTTFNPSFHTSEPVDDDGFLPPILDTGATHCLLPLDWLAYAQAAHSKRIHLKVASGTSVRALLYNNMIYCKTVSRPLLSVGQLKAMLDLRLVWDDSAPCLLACSGGLRYVLLRASVVHHLPVVSHEELHVLIEAIHLFTETGQLWDARQWSQKLGRKLSLYHWGVPITSLPTEHADFTEDPQVNFTAMRSPLPTSSHLPSSTVTFEDLDEEEPRKERTQELKGKRSTTSDDVSIDETLPTLTTPGDHFQDNSKQSSVLDPLSNNSSSLTSTVSEDKRTTNFASVLQEQTLPHPGTPTYHIQDTSSASSALPHPTDTDASTSTVHHRPLPSQLLHFLLEMMFWNPSKMMCSHCCSTLCPNPGHEPT